MGAPFITSTRSGITLIAAVAGLSAALGSAPAAGVQLRSPAVEEPSRAQLMEAAGADPSDPASLVPAMWRLIRHHPHAADAALGTVREREAEWLQFELDRRGVVAALHAKFGRSPGEAAPPPIDPERVTQEIVDELEARRLADPGRQLDALVREIERVGTSADLELLILGAKSTRTMVGAWRFYATIEGILEREAPKTVSNAEGVRAHVHLLAPLLRDLSPEKAGRLARELSKIGEASGDSWREGDWTTKLWLAWNLSEIAPGDALETFRAGLLHRDPAIRLFAGMGLLRITDADVAPFPFTDSPRETEAARTKWLEGLTVHRPDAHRFPNPFALPVIRRREGPSVLDVRVDLIWLDPRGSGRVLRAEEDVWPTVEHVLPDGSFYARQQKSDAEIALTRADGAVLVRFPHTGDWYDTWPASTGGFFGSGAYTDSVAPSLAPSGEYAPTGDLLWALPYEVRGLFEGGRGTAVVVGGSAHVVNRRGDVLWGGEESCDARWAALIGDERLLLTCTNDVKVFDKSGPLTTVPGFTSLGWVRYHPEHLWMIEDGGAEAVFFYDAQGEKRLGRTDL